MFVEYQKLSKKEKKKICNMKRRDWNGVCPVTKVIENKKSYNRKGRTNKRNEDI